ncbi:MAG: hypothetical protein M1416_02845 [Candidatus Pacearchaeota archaeon]|nr:hypothetical protein [Candidatus Pacearchaeota archaeon]
MKNKRGNQVIFAIIAIFAVVFLLVGFGVIKWKNSNVIYQNDPLPDKVSNLPSLNLTEVKTYENYKEFADKTNDLILILNEQGKFNIPLLKNTQEAWGEVSKKITKYGPLINNYQNLTESAKIFKNNQCDENYKNFYLSLGKFSLETSVIGLTLFYSVTFKTVGTLYRASGLNIIALKCPSCVSTVLSGAYWTIETVLVEESSKVADGIITKIKGYKQ